MIEADLGDHHLRRLDQVERELQQIKQKLDVPATSTPHQDLAQSKVDNAATLPGSSSATDRVQSSAFPHLLLEGIRERLSSKVLGEVELQPQMIVDLIEEYYTHYHSRMPILPDLADFIKHTNDSFLLFWTVMIISLRNKPDHQELYFRLAALVEALACNVSPPESRSFHAIQALVLLSCWPLPFGATRNDLSLTFATLATSNGLRLGLHRPKHPGDFDYNTSLDDESIVMRRKTWIACFIVAQSTSMYNGVPALIRFDQSLIEVLANRPPWLPNTLFHQLHVARHYYDICNALGNNEMTSNGLLPQALPTIRALDSQLRLHETQQFRAWSETDHVSFLSCRLLLYVFAWLDQNPMRGEDIGRQELSTYWLPLAYDTAVTIVHTASSIKEEIPYAMNHTRRCLFNALLLLLKLTHSSYQRLIDIDTVRNCINQGWTILRTCSLVAHDHMARVCAVIEYLSTNPIKQGSSQPDSQVSVTSRLGANLSVESVFRARDRFSKFVKDQRPSDYTEASVWESLLSAPEIIPSGSIWSADVDSGIVDWDAILRDLCST